MAKSIEIISQIITYLKDQGFKVEKMSRWRIKVNDRLIIYPISERWYDPVTMTNTSKNLLGAANIIELTKNFFQRKDPTGLDNRIDQCLKNAGLMDDDGNLIELKLTVTRNDDRIKR